MLVRRRQTNSVLSTFFLLMLPVTFHSRPPPLPLPLSIISLLLTWVDMQGLSGTR